MTYLRVLSCLALMACSSSGAVEGADVGAPATVSSDAATRGAAMVEAPPVCAARAVDGPAAGARLGELEFLGGVSLLGVTERIGGLSGLEAGAIAEGSAALTAISDDGHRLELSVEVAATGAIGAIDCVWSVLDGAEASAGKRGTDAEGLAALNDGRFAVSYERDHRIEIVGVPAGAGPAFTPTEAMASNQGLEALALLPDGALLAGAETPDVFARPHPVWRFAPTNDPAKPFADAAEPAFSIATEPGFGLTGFDVAPDGSLILLKRFWTKRTGSIVSVERLAPGVAETAEGIVRPQRLARLARSGPVPVDNFEGVAAMAGPNGETWLWLIADDNFNAQQTSYLYLFRWSNAGRTVAEAPPSDRS